MNKKVRDLFSRYAPASSIDAALSGKLPPQSFEDRSVDFVVLQVSDAEISQIPTYVSEAVAILQENAAHVGEIVSGLVFAYFGLTEADTQGESRRSSLASSLLTRMGSKVRVVHGRSKAIVGIVGAGTRYSFGPSLSNISAVMQELRSCPYGTSKEIRTA